MDQKAYNRAYYLARRDELLARSLVYQSAHLKQHSAATCRWDVTHPEVVATTAAKQRCTNPNNPGYKNYGGRGIVCHIAPKELITNIGYRPSVGYSLDRINNDGHYEVGNIRWATREQQNANRRD